MFSLSTPVTPLSVLSLDVDRLPIKIVQMPSERHPAKWYIF